MLLITLVISFSIEYNMFHYIHCPEIPMKSHPSSLHQFHHCGVGSIVEINGSVMFGAIDGNVYKLNEHKMKWNLVSEVKKGAALGVYKGKLVAVVDRCIIEVMVKEEEVGTVSSEKEMYRIEHPSCLCVVSVGECDLLVAKEFNVIEVFNGKTEKWHTAPPISHGGENLSAVVVHENLVFAAQRSHPRKHLSVYYAKINDLVSKILRNSNVVFELSYEFTHVHAYGTFYEIDNSGFTFITLKMK